MLNRKSRQTRIPDASKDDPQRNHRQTAEGLSARPAVNTAFYAAGPTAH